MKNTRCNRLALTAIWLWAVSVTICAEAPQQEPDVACANWIYAGSKSSVCFSPAFLDTVKTKTNITVADTFAPVRLDSDKIYEYPFAIMTGEGSFALREQERRAMKTYLERGGFVLASAGCSSHKWARSFSLEMQTIFPDVKMKTIPMDHPIFKTVYNIHKILLKRGGTTQLRGLELDGRIVLIYTPEGLNDTGNVKGCCCCGGNEIQNSRLVNANIFTYAVTH